MTKYYLILLLFLLPFISFSQNNILSGMQGLSLKEIVYFELKGYDITIAKEEARLDKKGIDYIKKEYGLKHITNEYSDKNIVWQNRVIENIHSPKKMPGITDYQLCYLLPETDSRMIVIRFHTVNQRDTLLERAFLNAFFDRSVVKYTSDNWTAEKVDFAGREITLGNACEWVAPHNVHCPAFGQISWSEFNTRHEAETNMQAQILLNKYNGQYKQIKEEDVNVVFEGTSCRATRIIYEIKKPKLLLGGRNLIAVYYVAEKVRSNFLSCVLIHYIEYKDDYRLPSLIEEVMMLRSPSQPPQRGGVNSPN